MKIHIILRKSVLVIETDLSDTESEDKLQVEKVIKFHENKLPVGMGAFAIGSELYLTGGEILHKETLSNGFNSSRLLRSLNSTVYLYQPDSRSFTVQDNIIRMNEPKTNPRVAEVDGKVYILSSYPHCMRDDDYKYPAPFECYDPEKNSWNILPEPPNYSTDPISHRIRGFFVFNSMIYMRNRYGFQSYIIPDRKWDYWEDIIDNPDNEKFRDWVSVAQGNSALTIVYVSGKGLVGYLSKANHMGTSLESVHKTLPPLENWKEGFVYHLGDNKFSYVLSTEGLEPNDWRVYLCDFKVEVEDFATENPPLLASVMSSRWFNCNEHISSPEVKTIQGVVFMANRPIKVWKSPVSSEEVLTATTRKREMPETVPESKDAQQSREAEHINNIGLEFASMVVRSGLPHEACTAICNTPSHNEDPPFSISIQVSQLLPNNGKIIAFRSSINCSVQNLEQEGKDLVPSSGTFFDFIATKVNPFISINKAAVQVFASLYEDSLSVLHDEIDISKPLLVTGNSLGGSIASLFTIWLLDTVYLRTSKRPICITFGSPLLGDINFQKAIYQRSSWPSCFLHVALSQDPIPNLFISPAEPAALAVPTYMPFGSFLFCSESGYTWFDQPESVIEVMVVAMRLESVGNLDLSGIQIDYYRRVLGGLQTNAICKGISELGDSDFNPPRVGIGLQLEAIGVIKTQQNDETNNLIGNITKRLEFSLLHKRNVVGTKRKLVTAEISMICLECYKQAAMNWEGYYDGYKKATVGGKMIRNKIRIEKAKLECYWKQKVEEAEQKPQKEAVTRWLFAGTIYRRMVEPLDIADYYLRGNRDYITLARPKHYVLLEKWFRNTNKPPSQTSKVNEGKKRKKDSLTEDSCFWAHVEEAVISVEVLKNRKTGQEVKDLAAQQLINFEVYIMDLIGNNSVSTEIFLERSTFMEWWKEYKQYKEGIIGAPYNSSLAIFMRFVRERYI